MTDLFVSLSAIIFLTIILREKKFKNYLNIYSILFTIFCIYMISISLISTKPILSLEASLFYLRYGLFFLAIIYSIGLYEKWSENLFISFLIAYSFVIFFCLIEIFFSFNITKYLYTGYVAEIQKSYYGNIRITGTFGEDIMLGSFISRTFPIFIASLIINYRNIKFRLLQYIALAYIPLLFFLNILSHERSAIIYFLIFILLFCFFNKNFKKISFLILSSIFIIFLSSLYFIQSFYNRFILTTLKQSSFLESSFFSIPEVYKNYFTTSLNIFLDNIWVGIGAKIYRLECKKYITTFDPCNTHPHNYYLQLLSELGILGFLPVALIFIILLYNVGKHTILVLYKNTYIISDYKYCLYISSIIALFPFLPTGSFYNNYTSAILYFSLALLAHPIKTDYKKNYTNFFKFK